MAFLQNFVPQQLLFLFSKHLDTMSNLTDCGTGQTDLWFLGLKSIAETFAKDEKGYYGVKKSSAETRKKIVAELMKEDKLGIAVRKAVSQLNKKGSQSGRGIIQNLFSKGILLALGGVMGYILRASMNHFEQELWFFFYYYTIQI